MPHIYGFRQIMQGMCRDRPPSLEGARGINAKKIDVGADIIVFQFTRWAVTARVQWAHYYAVAYPKALDAIAELGNLTGHFVANHLRQPKPLVHVSQIDMIIGATDASVSHLKLHLSWTGSLRARLTYTECLLSLVIGCFHVSFLQYVAPAVRNTSRTFSFKVLV
jgi:hypothetical protein